MISFRTWTLLVDNMSMLRTKYPNCCELVCRVFDIPSLLDQPELIFGGEWLTYKLHMIYDIPDDARFIPLNQFELKIQKELAEYNLSMDSYAAFFKLNMD